MERLVGLEPIVNQYIRVIVIDTFPDRESLKAKEYYANKRDLFWRLMGEILQQDMAFMTYERRTAEMLNKQVGLWDAIASCERDESADAGIRNPVLNDFSRLKVIAPGLQKVCFNGQNAAKYAAALEKNGYSIAIFPSTNPANTGIEHAEKLRLWRAGIYHGVVETPRP